MMYAPGKGELDRVRAARAQARERAWAAGAAPAEVILDFKGNYTGGCRFGSPLGPMQAAIRTMDRRMAIGRAREAGMSESAGDRLLAELNTIAGLSITTGAKRLKRYAISVTQAADDGEGGKKASSLKTQAALCALLGAVGAGYPALYDLVHDHKLKANDVVKNAAVGCAQGISAPPIVKWAKKRGFDLEA
jgi:hypothetical protein